MPNKLIFYPYNVGSGSAKILSGKFQTKRVRPDGKYKYFRNHIIVNWGNSHIPKWWTPNTKCLNHPDMVRRATNKLRTFTQLKAGGVSIPDYTNKAAEAVEWLKTGGVVVCRTTLSGHSGQGIVIAQKEGEMVPAPLYTKHVRHKREFRVHVFNTTIIDAVEKRKSHEGVKDTFVRSHDNGYVFCRENVVVPEAVKNEALQAIRVLGLFFGAVDIAYREKEKKAFVLEINTAPGIEGQTVDNYYRAFMEYQNAV